MRVDRLFGAAERLTPDLGEQLLLRDDVSGSAGEVEQQVELLAAQFERLARQCGRSRRGVDHQLADFDTDRLVARRSAQESTDPGIDLLGRERLHDVVVSACVKESHDLVFVVTGRADDQGHAAHGPEHLEKVAAVDVGEPEIEDHDVGRSVYHRLQRGKTAGSLGDKVTAGCQRVHERKSDAVVVFDDEHLGHSAG